MGGKARAEGGQDPRAGNRRGSEDFFQHEEHGGGGHVAEIPEDAAGGRQGGRREVKRRFGGVEDLVASGVEDPVGDVSLAEA